MPSAGKHITVAFLRREVAKVTGIKSDDADFSLALVMLAGAVVGPSMLPIVKLTQLPTAIVKKHVGTLRGKGIFTKNKIRADWFGKNGGIAFNLDLAVAKGWLDRS